MRLAKDQTRLVLCPTFSTARDNQALDDMGGDEGRTSAAAKTFANFVSRLTETVTSVLEKDGETRCERGGKIDTYFRHLFGCGCLALV